MVSNRFLGSIGNAIDSAASGTFLAKRASGPVFENLDYADISDYPTGADVDSAAIVNLIDSNFLSTRTPGIDITTTITDSGLNHIVPDSAGEAVKIGNYSKGIANVFADSSTTIKISSHTISLSNDHILFDGGNAASFLAASGGSSGIAWGGERGIIGGGLNADIVRTNVIQYITIATPGNATDFGDLTVARQELGAVSNSTRAVFGGGDTGSSILNTMDYVTTATTGNATDFGDLIDQTEQPAGCGDGTYGLFGGGTGGGTGSTNKIDYITVASTGNATDFGDLTNTRGKLAAANDATYGVWAGGDNAGTYMNTIDYVTMATTGNATDFGDLTAAIENNCGVGDTTRGVFAAGNGGSGRVNTIEYITIASPGNATDFGDLSIIKTGLGTTGCSDGTYGTFQGGYGGSSVGRVNTIEYITVQTTGNVTDFGDLIIGGQSHAGCSGNAS